MDRSFRPKTGRFGIMPVTVSAPLGTLTANNTTTIVIPTPPGKLYIGRVCVHQKTLVADADGTVLATLIKRRASDDQDVSLTTAVSLEVDVQVAAERGNLSFLSTLGDKDRILISGDTLEFDVVNNSAAIDTQPVGAFVVVELFYLE